MINKDFINSTYLDDKKNRITIGYLAKTSQDMIAKQILKGVCDTAEKYNVNVVCAIPSNYSEHDSAITNYNLISPHNVDGVVILASAVHSFLNDFEYNKLIDKFSSLPIISLAYPVANSTCITVDNYGAIRQVVEHLIEEHNINKIGFIKGEQNNIYLQERFNAYINILEEKNIDYNPMLACDIADVEDAYRVLFKERGLVPGKDIQAVITTSDIVAYKLIEELKNNQIRVPQDICVIGFNNRLEGAISNPTCTTIEPDFYQHGVRAVEGLLGIMNGKVTKRSIIMPTKLVVKQSCGCIEEPIFRAKVFPREDINALKVNDRNDLIKIITEKKHEIVRDIRSGNVEVCYEIPRDWRECLIDSFIIQLSDTQSNAFVYLLNSYIIKSRNKKDINIWQDILLHMRKVLLPYYKNFNEATAIEDLFHQSSAVLIQMLNNIIDMNNYVNSNTSIMYSHIGSCIASISDIEKLNEVFEKELSIYNTSNLQGEQWGRAKRPAGFYLSLYESDEKSRIVGAYRNGKLVKFDLKKNDFDRNKLMIDGILPEDKPFCLIVKPCYFDGKTMGYILFEIGANDDSFYEFMQSNISAALQTINSKNEKVKFHSVLEFKNKQLEEAIEEANKANAEKSKFMEYISHDIRTPLNSIMNFTEILSNAKDTEEKSYYLKLISQESETLLRIINQIQDVSSVESGRIKLHTEIFNLYSFIEAISSAHTVTAVEKGLGFDYNIEKGIAKFLEGDIDKLRQILFSLVDNTIKHTNSGSVRIDVGIKDQTDSHIRLIFKVFDSGYDLIKENNLNGSDKLSKILDNEQNGVLNMNLNIAKKFVEIMDGEIGLEDESNNGFVFWFTALFRKPQVSYKDVKSIDPASIKEKFTALLVDDYATNCKVAALLLKSFNCDIITAENGKLAVEKFKENVIDIILMDIQMPVMNGFEATKLIREEPRGKDVPILAITANAFNETLRRCSEEGMNDTLTKPFKKESFYEKIIYWLIRSGKVS